jgi:hypothetical protein
MTRFCILDCLLAMLAMLLAPAFAYAAPEIARHPSIWMHPSGREKGQPFRELFEHPEAWPQTRSMIDVLSNTDLNIDRNFTDDELRKDFALLKQWHIHFALETGAIKPWGKTADKIFSVERPMWERIERLGGEIYAVGMDEPLCCCRKEIKEPDDYAVRETANYIALVRKHFPDALVGDIEPYPFIPLADQLIWIDALQSRLAEMHVRGLDFYRLDVNWVEFTVFDRGSWPEVRKLERFCRQHKIPFSLIYWASGYPGFERRGIADDSTWYNLLMAQGYAYAAIDGAPDHVMIESWMPVPVATIPETDPWTFTRSVRDFCDRFAKPHAVPAATAPASK